LLAVRVRRASHEFSIEKALDKMMADWEGLAFELSLWKSTGTHILKGELVVAPAC
jgi:dynein heavy chain